MIRQKSEKSNINLDNLTKDLSLLKIKTKGINESGIRKQNKYIKSNLLHELNETGTNNSNIDCDNPHLIEQIKLQLAGLNPHTDEYDNMYEQENNNLRRKQYHLNRYLLPTNNQNLNLNNQTNQLPNVKYSSGLNNLMEKTIKQNIRNQPIYQSDLSNQINNSQHNPELFTNNQLFNSNLTTNLMINNHKMVNSSSNGNKLEQLLIKTNQKQLEQMNMLQPIYQTNQYNTSKTFPQSIYTTNPSLVSTSSYNLVNINNGGFINNNNNNNNSTNIDNQARVNNNQYYENKLENLSLKKNQNQLEEIKHSNESPSITIIDDKDYLDRASCESGIDCRSTYSFITDSLNENSSVINDNNLSSVGSCFESSYAESDTSSSRSDTRLQTDLFNCDSNCGENSCLDLIETISSDFFTNLDCCECNNQISSYESRDLMAESKLVNLEEQINHSSDKLLNKATSITQNSLININEPIIFSDSNNNNSGEYYTTKAKSLSTCSLKNQISKSNLLSCVCYDPEKMKLDVFLSAQKEFCTKSGHEICNEMFSLIQQSSPQQTDSNDRINALSRFGGLANALLCFQPTRLWDLPYWTDNLNRTLIDTAINSENVDVLKILLEKLHCAVQFTKFSNTTTANIRPSNPLLVAAMKTSENQLLNLTKTHKIYSNNINHFDDSNNMNMNNVNVNDNLNNINYTNMNYCLNESQQILKIILNYLLVFKKSTMYYESLNSRMDPKNEDSPIILHELIRLHGTRYQLLWAIKQFLIAGADVLSEALFKETVHSNVLQKLSCIHSAAISIDAENLLPLCIDALFTLNMADQTINCEILRILNTKFVHGNLQNTLLEHLKRNNLLLSPQTQASCLKKLENVLKSCVEWITYPERIIGQK